MVGQLGNFWWLGELGQAWGEYGRSGEVWGRNVLGCVGRCRGCGEGVGNGVGGSVKECMG